MTRHHLLVAGPVIEISTLIRLAFLKMKRSTLLDQLANQIIHIKKSHPTRVAINLLLLPLGPDGSLQYRTATFDYRTDSPLKTLPQLAATGSILLFDGVFLLRSELAQHWDFTIFVDAAFDVTLARAKQRDAVLFGGVDEVRRRYEQRYIPGQQLYFDKSRPWERANVVIDNNRE